ncbi:MAG: type III pantothenate kinase [Bacteroidota bacterium]
MGLETKQMLLAIDIGNTDTVIGVHFEDRWQHLWRIPTRPEESLYYYETRLKNYFLEADLRFDAFRRLVLSSVVPVLTPVLDRLMEQLFGKKPLTLGPELYLRMPFGIQKPYEIGSDLVANAYAAHRKYTQNLVVVDFGTALTFTSVAKEGRILGVAIAPGLKTAIQSLASNTAQLPEVPLTVPESAIGTDTVGAIQAGILMGYVGLVKHLIANIRQEMGGDCIAIATGGLSSVLEPLATEFVEVNRMLTLEGLRGIGELALEA